MLIGCPAALRACVSLKLSLVPPIPNIFPFLGVSEISPCTGEPLGMTGTLFNLKSSETVKRIGRPISASAGISAASVMRKVAASGTGTLTVCGAATTGAGAGVGGKVTAGFAAIGTGVGVGATTGTGSVLTAVATGAPCLVFCLAFCGALVRGAGPSGTRFGFRICSMISGATPLLDRRITSGVDKSKLVLSAERIWLRMRSEGTFWFTISRTLSFVSVVSGGVGGGATGGASTTGAGGGVCAANSAAVFSAACFFMVHQAPPPPTSRITTKAPIPIIAFGFEADCTGGGAAVATAEAWVFGALDGGPMEGGGSGAVSRVV